MAELKPGDVVQLFSGGPKMTVEKVVVLEDKTTMVYCVWFDDGQQLRRGILSPTELSLRGC